MFAQRFLVSERKRRRSGEDSGSGSEDESVSDEDGSVGVLGEKGGVSGEINGTEESGDEDAMSEEEEVKGGNRDVEESNEGGESADGAGKEDGGEFGEGIMETERNKGNNVDERLSQINQNKDNSETNGGTDDMEMEIDEEYVSKHKSIFDKFNSIQTESKTESSETNSTKTIDDSPGVHDIKPLPQPRLPRDHRLRITASNTLNWLADPIYVNPDQSKPFEEIGLSTTMIRNLKSNEFNDAFSVQIKVIETLLTDAKENKLKPDSNGDLLVNASTGSGKTLAYSIPIIETLSTRIVPKVRAIVLVPTKPLVNQVKATFLQLSKGTSLQVMNFRSDISLKEEAAKLTNVPDIIISTPGRLVDHITDGSLNLQSLRYLVIDEADRLLNQSFQNWCNILVAKIDSYQQNRLQNWNLRIQKLIFSATLTTDAGKLSLLKFYKPRLVIVNDQEQLVNEMFSTPKNLNEFVIKWGSNKTVYKPLLLYNFLYRQGKLSNVLVFTKSNEASIRLAKLLEVLSGKSGTNVKCNYLNSTNNTSVVRNKIFKQFRTGEIGVLVVTDLIARGIDELSITDVINYDMPNSAREYVHRVGRTARANNSGNSYTLVFGKGEYKWFNKIMGGVSRRGGVEEVGDVEVGDRGVYEEALTELQRQS